MIQTTINQAFRHNLHSCIIKLCHSQNFPLHWNRKGPKLFTNYQRVGLILLFLRSRKSLRDFIKELPELKWTNWLGLKSLPKKSTLHDWLKLFDLKTIRKFLQEILKREQPSLMAIDSTGIDSWQRSRHYQWRIGESHMPYAKFDVFVDVDKKLIHDFVLRIKPRHDALGAKSIFQRMKLTKVKILADGAYDAENLHCIVRKKGNKLYAPVRKSSRKTPKGFFRKQCVKKDKEYGMRNCVECVIKAFKQVRVSALRSKKAFMKKREIAWNIIIYNLERMDRIINIILWLIKEPFRT